jgi:hypothetical protein
MVDVQLVQGLMDSFTYSMYMVWIALSSLICIPYWKGQSNEIFKIIIFSYISFLADSDIVLLPFWNFFKSIRDIRSFWCYIGVNDKVEQKVK